MDTVSQEQRSRNMAAIKAKNTKPELAVRRFLHAWGLRYRLHAAELPGKPDLVFRRRNAVVFVHGCFWHQCPYCQAGKRKVRSNTGYWHAKIERNKARDAATVKALKSGGWKVFVIWECQVADPPVLKRLSRALLRLKAAYSVSG
ncbi:very short patch repair endonuclease [Bradyrhizobium manausense]|uniref:very short patch repair endonuclease n=1 Tax=Bradyrhizobium manausense TaxID=989370 RepID=UPI001BA7A379|nr:very short patch repair endonuclease [Bradyrhizobium manausense]MBR0689595.1 very short patch repair endonuclease [Bradyrhizobium manausense]